jgi:hypothetical protein
VRREVVPCEAERARPHLHGAATVSGAGGVCVTDARRGPRAAGHSPWRGSRTSSTGSAPRDRLCTAPAHTAATAASRPAACAGRRGTVHRAQWVSGPSRPLPTTHALHPRCSWHAPQRCDEHAEGHHHARRLYAAGRPHVPSGCRGGCGALLSGTGGRRLPGGQGARTRSCAPPRGPQPPARPWQRGAQAEQIHGDPRRHSSSAWQTARVAMATARACVSRRETTGSAKELVVPGHRRA